MSDCILYFFLSHCGIVHKHITGFLFTLGLWDHVGIIFLFCGRYYFISLFSLDTISFYICHSRWDFVRIIFSLKYLKIAQISKDISNYLKISKSSDVLTLGGGE